MDDEASEKVQESSWSSATDRFHEGSIASSTWKIAEAAKVLGGGLSGRGAQPEFEPTVSTPAWREAREILAKVRASGSTPPENH